MKATLLALFVGLMMGGCGEETVSHDPSDPWLSDSSESPLTKKNDSGEDVQDAHLTIDQAKELANTLEGGMNLGIFDSYNKPSWGKELHTNGKLRFLGKSRFVGESIIYVEWGQTFFWYENGMKKEQYTKYTGQGIDMPLGASRYEGIRIAWHENGNKEYELRYDTNGKRIGLLTEWYENGQKKTEGNYKDGEVDGLWTNWSRDGKVTAQHKFTNGAKGGVRIKGSFFSFPYVFDF